MPHQSAQVPDTLSELIEMAIDDMDSLDRDKYIVDMGHWFTFLTPAYIDKYYNDDSYAEDDGRESYFDDIKPGQCLVCLAGAVMAKRLGAGELFGDPSSLAADDCEISPHAAPGWISYDWRRAMSCLNAVRMGKMADAVHYWSHIRPVGDRTREWAATRQDAFDFAVRNAEGRDKWEILKASIQDRVVGLKEAEARDRGDASA